MRGSARSELAERVAALVERCRAGRQKLVVQGELRPEFKRLAKWQADRLCWTHRDLLASGRFGPAARFFFTDLYGDRDYSPRDEDMERVYPVMVRMMPRGALESVAQGMEVHALTQELDYLMIQHLREGPKATGPLTAEQYAGAYRCCDNGPDRERQIMLISQVGRALDSVVHHRLVYNTVLLARRPAHMAGFGALHDFIERGFVAFRHMRGADEFIDTIERRELAVMRAILSEEPASAWAFPEAGAGRKSQMSLW